MTHSKVYSAKDANGVLVVVHDVIEGFRMHPVWRAFAWDQLQHRYRRSMLGLAWIGISFVIFVVAISFFFGGFSEKRANDFIAYVAIGFAAFQFIIGIIVGGCEVFRTSATWIKSAPLPYSIYVYKNIAGILLPFAIHLSIAVIALLLLGIFNFSQLTLLAMPAFIVYLVNAVPAQILLGTVTARFADFSHLIQSITRILFFTTPILWVREERGGIVGKVADLNPLTHYIEIFRAPLLGQTPRLESWIIVATLTVLIWVAAILIAANMRRRLPFWV